MQSIKFRDINPNNVMIVEENNSLELKLIDFNVSKKFRDEESYNKLLMRTNTGAAAFIAPELHKQEYYE